MKATLQNSNWWLDQVKERFECRTDTALAELLLTTKGAISMQRHGVGQMQVKTAVRCAQLLHVNPLHVICGVMFHSAATEGDREFWRDVFDRTQYRGEDRRGWIKEGK